MSIPSILKKDTNIDMQENNINDLVASASRVIAPLCTYLYVCSSPPLDGT